MAGPLDKANTALREKAGARGERDSWPLEDHERDGEEI